ncbi:hypothetical protein [Puniceibacterium sp. IMCC21224]|uniref:hypothetical protein n=1 Tax=Puniceibacterium sp. IMCC21224 TaxID=1618204 RepID=UPI00064DFCB3|nr:hypothetical protein [Puniceibacterium sp. IMCC21224]KMK65340.1 hypothetical protein IMCC21224_11171 [Puniceibacterium sp. IMCC21224]
MRNSTVMGLLLTAWAAAFVASLLFSWDVEGPRNIDTGLKRLDVLFKWQLIAICIALAAAVSGFVLQGGGKWQRFVGLLPIGLTCLIIGGTVGIALLQRDPLPEVRHPAKPTAPAVDAVPLDSN